MSFIVHIFKINRVGEGRCYTVNLMEAIQGLWSIENIENNPELLQQMGGTISSTAKERHRKAMIDWSNQVRGHDPGCFCRAACQRGFSSFPFSFFHYT